MVKRARGERSTVLDVEAMRTATQRDYEERILRVLVHIQNHLDDALDLEQLAALAHFSPFHFHRVFRGMVGEPVAEHVRRLRLERAAHQLRGGDAPITSIAFSAGYDTHEAFSRAFRNRFAQSPSGFRAARRDVPETAAPSGVHFSTDGQVPRFTPRQAEGDEMETRIEELETLNVAFVRHVGPYQGVGAAWGQLCAWAGPRGLMGPQTVMFGMCHDDPDVTPADRIRYDACIVVGADVRPEGQVGVQQTAGGTYAVTQHRGSYAGFANTYATLMGQWLPAHGHEPIPDLPSLEFYRNDPNQTPEADLVTDIYVPVKPAGGG